MWRIFEFLRRFGNILLFLFLEFVAFMLIINLNDHQRAISQGFFLEASGKFQQVNADIQGYFNLGKKNDSLHAENQRLHMELVKLRGELNAYKFRSPFAPDAYIIADSLLPKQRFRFERARVINNSTHLYYNYITLNKGANQGVEPGMGVVSPSGVVGMITDVSPNFSMALSALNLKSRISGRLVRNGNVGTLVWEGGDPNFAILNYIPVTSPLERGDTMLTSGFSSHFSPGYMVGTVYDYIAKEDGFYKIKIRLAANFRALDHVYLVQNEQQAQIDTLQSKVAEP